LKKLIKVLIADEIDFQRSAILSKKTFHIKHDIRVSNSEIIKRYRNFDVLIIRSSRKIDEDFLAKCNFKIIATCSRGTDHIDTKAAKKFGVRIISSEGANSVSAAEHTMALILAIEKKYFFITAAGQRK